MDQPLYILNDHVREIFATPAKHGHCFGYYYCSPISADGRYMLAHRTYFESRDLSPLDSVELGYFTLADGAWHPLASTRAFNWQQGAMLQWLGPDFRSRVIYNDQDGDCFVARILDITDGSLRTIPHAIYAVHPSGESALGVCFERHFFTRAYHYEGVRAERWDVPVHDDDGILHVDLRSGASRMIIRTADMARAVGAVAEDGTPHWLEHLLWNPSGSRFAFLHRFGTNEGFCTRVFTADPDGSGLRGLPENFDYSHMGWRCDDQFVIYAKRVKPLAHAYAKMATSKKPYMTMAVAFYRRFKHLIPLRVVARSVASCGYAFFTEGKKEFKLIDTGSLFQDGHPSWTRNGRYMLTDTYADSAGFRHLMIYDAEQDRLHTLGRFLSPFNNTGYRCDLHPRFSPDEQWVIIDTAHSGQRQMLVLEVDWPNLSASI